MSPEAHPKLDEYFGIFQAHLLATSVVWVATIRKSHICSRHLIVTMCFCAFWIEANEYTLIMGWETLDMVVRYTRSVKFEDSLKVYQGAMNQ